MTTLNQLCKNNQRQKKLFKSKTPGLEKNPQQKGICIKIFTRTPKKTKFGDSESSTFKTL